MIVDAAVQVEARLILSAYIARMPGLVISFSGALKHDSTLDTPLASLRKRQLAGMTIHAGQRPWASVAAIFILWLAIFGPGLFHPYLFDDADGAHAEAGREMLTLHDWVTLHENGIRYLEKAPLPYWAMAISFRLFGVSEWSARLAQGLGVLLLALLLLQIGRKFLGSEAGLWAGIVSVTSFGPYLFTRILIPDLLVGLWIGLGLYFFLRGWQEQSPTLLSCWSLAATVALNVLTKGLIGMVFPGVIIFCFLLLIGDLRHLFKMRLISSTLVFLVVAAPWHVLAALRNPPAGQAKGFLWFYFVNEHFLRYLGKRYPADYGTFPLILFWGMTLVWLLPWSAFLPQAVWQARLRLLKTADQRTSPDAALLLFFVWAMAILLFFSFSTRQEYYLAPALPAFALLLGHWLAEESHSAYGADYARSGRLSATVFLVVGVVIAAVTGALAIISHAPPPGVGLVDLLNKNPDAYVLSLGHFLDLTGSAMSMFRGPLIGTALAFLCGSGLNWFLRRRGSPRSANWALALMMCVFIECAHVALGVFAPVLGSKPLAAAIQNEWQPGDQIICDGEYANSSSVNFYTGQQMLIFNGRINGLWYGSLFPDAAPIFIEDAELARIWAGAGRVYFVTGSDKRRPYLENIAPAYQLAKSGGKLVLSNRPEQVSSVRAR
jgi:4-amino-4-deoxy-L-arabinose transferase-like glycosyltransferase